GGCGHGGPRRARDGAHRDRRAARGVRRTRGPRRAARDATPRGLARLRGARHGPRDRHLARGHRHRGGRGRGGSRRGGHLHRPVSARLGGRGGLCLRRQVLGRFGGLRGSRHGANLAVARCCRANARREPEQRAAPRALAVAAPSHRGGALLVFVDCMKELPATLLLRPLGVETLATHLYGEAIRGTYEDAAIAALLIVVAGLLPVIALARIGRRTSAADVPDTPGWL